MRLRELAGVIGALVPAPCCVRAPGYVTVLSILLSALVWQPACKRSPDNLNRKALSVPERACSGCHEFPPATVLPRSAWPTVLRYMAPYLGRGPVPHGGNIVDRSRVVTRPLIDDAEWALIRNYYTRASGLHARPNPGEAQASQRITEGLALFRPEFKGPRGSALRNAVYTLAAIDERQHRIVLGQAGRGMLRIIPGRAGSRARTTGQTRTMPLRHCSPVHAHFAGKGRTFVSCIGSFAPSNRKVGLVGLLNEKTGSFSPVSKELYRLVHASYADLDGDGRLDIALAEFGHHLGRLSWLRGRADGSHERRLLLAAPGTVGTVVADFTGDGRPDLIAALGQAREGLFLFPGGPRGPRADSMRVLRRDHPAFGTSAVIAADFNGDGRPDLAVTNGDNGDLLGNPLKPYHGVRIHLNQGQGRFQQSFFYSMHGAYQVAAADFDLDGDLDLVVSAFFPDFRERPLRTFVYLENRTSKSGALQFVPRTLRAAAYGRWLRMVVGDVDGDGDADIVLAAAYVTQLGSSGRADWMRTGFYKKRAGVLLLRNRTRRP